MYLNVMTKRGQDGLQQVAEATGGTAFVPDREEDLESVFAQIAAELRAQYLLQYYSNSQAAGVQFRRVAVTMPARPDLAHTRSPGLLPKSKVMSNE